ncbi:unnamed protein product [Didymodactylos carnosus]|uniref:LamG-like jellyroll fold domain-containing protein n=1 Tax=Didymodactylos carnosus TaxID=1234261 RepID=A0A813ZBW6_9BILA|nr:unnamed protein product [Didymodactylos carnosus]CAF0896045.1 unnamed protein product [Didymodactylos carnosus]CAF3514497.1 unnamed protein product [Didymodactylos carnosus]CAF3679388.1 unnamed protein product [Didymodactylos carnosus]
MMNFNLDLKDPSPIVDSVTLSSIDKKLDMILSRLDKIAINNNAPNQIQDVNAAPNDVSGNLIGWWKFNNSFNDSSGVIGDNYKLYGEPKIEDCFLGKCAVFNGDESIDVDVSNKSQYQLDLYTVSIWFLAADGANGWRTAVGSWEHDVGHCWIHLGFDDKNTIQNQTMVSSGQCQFDCDSNVTVESDKWYHVVALVSRNLQQIWINGTLAGAKDMSSVDYADDIHRDLPSNYTWSEQKLHTPLQYIHIGSKNDEHHNPWCGKIADLSIWNRWLTPDEIRAMYNQKISVDQIAAGTHILTQEDAESMPQPVIAVNRSSKGFHIARQSFWYR